MHYQAPSNTTKHPRPHPFIMTLLTAPMKSNQEIQLKTKIVDQHRVSLSEIK